MKAIEARKKALEISNAKDEFQLTSFLDKVKQAAKDGRFSITLDATIRKDVKIELEHLGYNVDVDSHMNESYVTITW